MSATISSTFDGSGALATGWTRKITPVTAIANSALDPATNAIDGNLATHWHSAGEMPTWWRGEFSTPQAITRVTMKNRDWTTARCPKDFQILGSSDGTTWTVLSTQTGVVWASTGETKTFDFVNTTEYKYYRLSITANNGDNYVNIAELGFFKTWVRNPAMSSSFSGSGTLATQWTNFRRYSSAFTGAGTLSTLRYRLIQSAFSSDGVLGTSYAKRTSARTNIIPNPSFEVNTTGVAFWQNSGAVSTEQALFGSKSLKVTYTSNQSGGGSDASYTAGLTSGVTYTYSAWVYVPTGYATVRIQAGRSGMTPVLSTPTTKFDQWERLSLTFTSTATATHSFFILNETASTAGTFYYLDGVLVEASAALRPYFDGNSAGAVWNGTANNSTSTVAGPLSLFPVYSGSGQLTSTGFPRVNLLTNPSGEIDAFTYSTVNGSSVVSSADRAYAGTKSFKVTIAGNMAAGQTGMSRDSFPLTGGKTYTFSAWVWVPSGMAPVRINYGGPSINVIGTSTTTFDQWERIYVTASIGSSIGAYLYVLNSSTSVAGSFYVDGLMLEEAPAPNGYFDGSTANTALSTYAWTGAVNGSTSTETPIKVVAGNTISSAFGGSGSLSTGLVYQKRISSAFTGAGALATALTNYRKISSGLSGSGVLATVWSGYRNYRSGFSGAGVLSTYLGKSIRSDFTGSGVLTTYVFKTKSSSFTGSGTLSTYIVKTLRSGFNGDGALSTVLVFPSHTASNFSGNGQLGTLLAFTRRFATAYGSEGILQTELGYVMPVPELGTAPLGKLVAFNVGSSAVPLNPAEGSGAAPTVSATYVAGPDVEFALGEYNVLSNDSVGTYAGEIVSLDTEKTNDLAVISTNTPLTRLNLEMALFPFIDSGATTWAAARAIEYWTQQCGLFYDDVPGTCVSYASGFGHTAAYAAGSTKHFYEKPAGSTAVLNNRSVHTFSGLTAFHEDAKEAVPVSLSKNELLVFSIGLGIRGTGRTASVTWNFLDSTEAVHTLRITGTSEGLITAEVDDVLIDSTTVAGTANYRVTAALERLSGTALGGRLTVHTDDLNGALTEAYSGSTGAIVVNLPGTMRLKSVNHVSVGGSSTQMLRWGTYLTVTESLPRTLPVLKSLAQTETAREFVSGFEGNVWNLLNEFCSIARLDIQYLDNKLTTSQRISTLTAPGGNFSEFQRTASRRDKFKQVAVVNRQSKAVTTDDAIFWRADSVYQVAAREVFETTIQTDHSILSLVQPTAVLGIEPFPYKKGGGQYVVTGADGYIISPAWWAEHGGKVEVSLTEKSGEIAIKITAPALDTVRAPYRISEGAGDRPALYVAGSGILNDPIEVHVGTGALNAKEGFDSVYESPFISTVSETYDAAIEMAAMYSADVAEISFTIPNSFGKTSRFGQFPSGALFTDNVSNYRIVGVNQTHSKVSGTAVPHTSVAAYVDSFPADATIADEMARHAGLTLKQVIIKPLRGTIETA